MDVLEPVDGVDLDHDGGRVGLEELIIDPEDELVVPRGVVVAIGVDPGGELAVQVDPCDRIRSHRAADLFEVLGRDDVQL